MFRRTFPKPTPEQQARQDRARELGCIACLMNGEVDRRKHCGRPQIHHLTVCGRQLGQDESVCLGEWHHMGIVLPGNTTSIMTDKFGPSLAKGSKPFHARYGSNAELLAYQNKLIGESHDAT